MGVPTSEVGYTPATPRREDHEVHRTCGGIGKKNICVIRVCVFQEDVILYARLKVIDYVPVYDRKVNKESAERTCSFSEKTQNSV